MGTNKQIVGIYFNRFLSQKEIQENKIFHERQLSGDKKIVLKEMTTSKKLYIENLISNGLNTIIPLKFIAVVRKGDIMTRESVGHETP